MPWPNLPAPVLLDPALIAGQFHFTLAAMPGQRIIIQDTPGFQTWTAVATDVMVGTTTNIALPADPESSPHFYRAMLVP